MFLTEAAGIPFPTPSLRASPWPKAGYFGVASSLFCFERDPRGLYFLPFQKAEVLGKLEPVSRHELRWLLDRRRVSPVEITLVMLDLKVRLAHFILAGKGKN
jgi:hypothetical protein